MKLFALFVYKVGYKGLLVFLDAGVNLYKITHKQARDSNYEKILTIFNDTMQGKARLSGIPAIYCGDFFCHTAVLLQ